VQMLVVDLLHYCKIFLALEQSSQDVWSFISKSELPTGHIHVHPS
jgi:hypothetical protein